jgi:D-inositol-3-phosphate glycosyltransferase
VKGLYFPVIPPDFENHKSQEPSKFTLFGTAIYVTEFFKALLRYSSYDVIYLPNRARQARGDMRDSELFASNTARIKLLAEHELGDMRRADHLILASPGPQLADLIRIRRLCGRPQTPVTGIIHSISYSPQLLMMLHLFLSPLQHFDALICSSTAGCQAIVNFLNHMKNRFAAAHLGEFHSNVQTPIIPLGVEIQDFTLSSPPVSQPELPIVYKPVILYFGRFSPTSKADLFPLMLVFAELLRSYPEIALVLAGDDTHYRMAGELESFARDLGCADHVRIVPNPTFAEKQMLYGQADVFVSVSDNLQETFGITIVEAMAAGLPVVASDWNGYKDLVVNGNTGYLIPTFMPKYPRRFDDLRGSGNMAEPDLLAATTIVDTAALKDALEKLLTDKDHRCRLGRAGQKRARDLYDWKQVIRQYEYLWGMLAEEANRSRLGATLNQFDLTEWGYEEIFSHYATGLIGSELQIQITERGRYWRQRPEMLARVAVPKSWFRLPELRRILDLLDSKKHLSVAEVYPPENNCDEDPSSSDLDAVRSLSHICRLIKYGLVEIRVLPGKEGSFRTFYSG